MKDACVLALIAIVCAGLTSCSGAVSAREPSASSSEGADLVVVAPSVSDGSLGAGVQFTLTVTVRNVGVGTAAATAVRYYRSADAEITATDGDDKVGSGAVPELAASGSSSRSVDLTAPEAAGTYYYGACVEPSAGETDTTNNCSPSVRVMVHDVGAAVRGKPDLVVASVSVSDGAPARGAGFTLSATVRNAGGGAAAATTVRYYRSADAEITTSDTQVGTDEVPELAGSGSDSQSVQLTAPSEPGTYHYGACVAAVAGETDATNNCSAAVRVRVAQPRHPDLTVAASVSDGSPAVGTDFTLSATVRNGGNGVSGATTLRYYRSKDATITTSDTEAGTAAIAGLAAAGSASESVELTAPGTPGTYYYGACADVVAGETDARNNCSAAIEVSVPERVTVRQGTPDLAVAAPSVSDADPPAGAGFTLSATVNNEGDGAAAATTLRYYRSTDATITTSDTQVGTDAIAALGASGSASESVELTAPATPGTYHYGACVDTVTGETDTADNCSAAVAVTVPEPKRPDLTVTAPSVSDATPGGSRFTLSATVRNGGDGAAEATTLRYYRSTDTTITTSDTEVGTDAIAELAASGSASESVELRAPSTPGTYYYGACVDTVTDESDSTNNCSASVLVSTLRPDLVVGSPSVSESNPAAGATFTLSATVSNTGAGEANATTLRYYQSTDATVTTDDTQVGFDPVVGLAAAAESPESISLRAPHTAGTHYYGACVRAVTNESDTTNNCSTAVAVTVAVTVQEFPDLEVGKPTVDDATPAPGGRFTLTATVSNSGDGEAAGSTLRAYRSVDTTISTSDFGVGTAVVGTVSASGSRTVSVSTTAPASPGPYHYGVCVDAVTGETDTTNNCSPSVRVEVEAEEQPDGPTIEVTHQRTTWPVPAGDTVTFTARVLDGDGNEVDTPVTWSSNNTAVATVDTNGVVTAVAEGTARVAATATLPGNLTVSGSHVMTVIKRAERVVVTPHSLSLDEVGATAALKATVYDADGNEMRPVISGWSSSDREVATVASRPSPFGSPLDIQVKAIGEGTATVSFLANFSATGTASLTVTIPDARVDVSPDTLRFDTLADSKTVTVSVLDENGDEDEDATFTWTSSFKSGVGTSIGDGGLGIEAVDEGLEITANEVGRGEVTVSSGDVAAAILLVYVGQTPVSLTVSPDALSVAVSGTAELSAAMEDANGHPVQINDGSLGNGGKVVSWETDDANVATVDGVDDYDPTVAEGARATVTAVKPGTAKITGSYGSLSDTATITVTATNNN